jgi:hypothetical protein
MGVDCGFDIYPPLECTKANQEQYELFLREVLDTYGPRNGDDAEQGDGGSVVRVNAESAESYIDFEVGEHPHLPRRCEHFLRFSSKVSGRSLAEPYIRGVYKIVKQWFGDRVYFWHEMNDFGPHIRHYGCYNWSEIYAARKRIGEHKQQAEEREQEETKTQDEVQQGDDGKDRMADIPASRDGLYTIKPITGKGLGFIAASKISKGTRILLEVPLFETPDSSEDISSAEIIVLQEVKSLTKDQQRAFFALQNVQRRNKCSPVLGIAITNMLPLGASNSGGLFLEASRINHSCQPNAQHAWNDDLGHLTVHALRDIEADREITISYISGVSLGYAERQRHLMGAFSFACVCELCSLPVIARTESDYRLDQIRSIEDEGAATDLDQVLEHPAKSLSQIHRLFELLEEEGICDIRFTRACFNAFQIAAVVGDKARAKVFAERAYAARKVFAGDDSPMTIEFKHLAKQPVNYHLFGKRFHCYDDNWEAPREICGEEFENWLWNTDGWSRHSSS